MKRSTALLLAVFAALVAMPVLAMAFSTPTSGSLAYEVYDIAVNRLLQGPVGYVGGLGLITFGIVTGVMGKGSMATSVLSILGGGALANANGITTSLGKMM